MDKKQKAGTEKSGFSWIYVALILVAIGTFAFMKGRQSSSRSHVAPEGVASAPVVNEEPHDFRMPAYLENPQVADLARTMDPALVSSQAQDGYQVARQKPLLLAQLPCFCYCDRFGHGSLHDCFVSKHAETCDICLKEALEANQMDQRGTEIVEIRKQIVDRYRPRESRH